MRHKRHSRNPGAALGTSKEWLQGVNITQVFGVGAGLGGTLAFASLLKPGDPATPSWSYKAGKMLMCVGGALFAGAFARSFFGEKTGQAAFLGGIAATGVEALQLFTPVRLGQLGGVLSTGPATKENVNMISP